MADARSISGPVDRLVPYVPRLLIEWLGNAPDEPIMVVDGTLAFVDISGFTKLTERLARAGKVGAEELNDVLDSTFGELLAAAYMDGAGLVKWGGDAVLLLFDGEHHAARGCRAAHRMRAVLRQVGRIRTMAGSVTLRMSIGIHSGAFLFLLTGDPRIHRELIVAGPAVTNTVNMEQTAGAGQIVISQATASQLEERAIGERLGDGWVLRRVPPAPGSAPPSQLSVEGVDLAVCLPVPIRELLTSGGAHPEHRPVTAAFVEFKGVDALAERDPLALHRAIDHVVRVAQKATQRHGVTFFESDISADGGKLMLIAGAPRTTGRDEEAMLLAAREITGSAAELPVRIGINSGHVFSGDFGPPFRRTYSVKGDAINLAARVMGKAEFGSVLATARVLEGSRRRFETHEVEPFMVKGKSRAVHAFVVGSPTLVARSTPDEHVPLVGRIVEMRALSNALEAARAGDGEVIEIVGPAGLGKSRLLEEFRWSAPWERFLWVGAEAYDTQTPYRLARRLLRAALGIDELIDPLAAGERLTRWVSESVPELMGRIPLLALAMDAAVSSTSEVDALAERNKPAILRRTVVELLAAALPGTATLILEDLHWADEPSFELLSELVRHPVARRWLLCATRRPDGPRLLEQGVPGRAIVLEPLGGADSEVLARRLAREHALAPRDIRRVVDRAAGNPLFVRELVAGVADLGDLSMLPESLEALIGARIDRLSGPDRLILRHAAVIGPVFSTELLEHVLGDLGVLESETLVRFGDFVIPEADGTWRFEHALIRDVAYEGLPFKRRRATHLRLGVLLEERAGDDLADASEALSLHFHLAHDWERSWRFSVMAGDRAHAKFANEQAADFYVRALSAGRQAEVSAADLARVEESLGDVCERAGLFDRGAEAITHARRLSGVGGSSIPRLLRKQGNVAERSGRFSRALRWYGRGIRAAEELGFDQERIELLMARASALYWQSRYREVTRLCEQVVEESSAIGYRGSALAHAYYLLHLAHTNLVSPERVRYRELALPIYEELGDLAGAAKVYNNLGIDAYYEGDWDEARRLYERARDAHERVGNEVFAADCINNIAEILSDQGHLREAEPLLSEVAEIYRAAGERAGIAYAEGNLGRLAARAGRAAEGLARLEEAARTFEQLRSRTELVMTQARISECLLLLERPADAFERADTSLRRAIAQGEGPAIVSMLHRVLGYAEAQLGERDQALDELVEAERVAREGDVPFELVLALEARGRLLPGGPERIRLRKEAEAIFARLGVHSTLGVPMPEGMST